jgi:hypothetical protein
MHSLLVPQCLSGKKNNFLTTKAKLALSLVFYLSTQRIVHTLGNFLSKER